MHRFQRIVTGVDFEGEALTLGSAVAARRALVLAQRTGASVDFMHSTVRDDESGGSAASEDTKRATVAALRAEHGSGVAGEDLITSDERPWIGITKRVLRGDADLVVVATRNQSQRDERRLGSVTMQLVRHCPAPVWAVKPEHELVHRCVVAATDLSPVGDLATEYAAFIARADECQLCVVHAWQTSMEMQLGAARMSEEEVQAECKRVEDRARSHIQGQVAVQELGDRAKVYLACAAPSAAILALVEKQQPDLVVMGSLSRSGIAGLVVGNTAERLLHRLDCSLLTVKPDSFESPVTL